MQINVKDLIVNPINPRSIRKDAKIRLQQSIMLFPKMLQYRDIIINEDNVVLAGNQRTTILQTIAHGKTLDWLSVLQENEKWVELSDQRKDEVLITWKRWIDNPLVEVSVAKNLTKDEEKELILKDNKEFGEYDFDALQRMYDDNNLINFGFDEGLFYNMDEDETVVKKSTLGTRGKAINLLTFGKNQIAVNKEEYEELVRRYDEYVESTGVDFGFVTFILTLNPEENGNNKD